MNMQETEKSPARLALALTILLAGSFLLAIVGFGGSSNAQVDPYASTSPTVLPTQIATSPDRTDHTASPDDSPGDSPGDSPTVLPTRLERDEDGDDNNDDNEGDDEVSGILPTNVQGGALPFTGGDLVLFAATGASIIGTGSLLVRRSRKR